MKILLTCLIILFLTGCTNNNTPYKNKKIMYINSYHKGYSWSDGIEEGIQDTIQNTGIKLSTFKLDSKRNPDIFSIKKKAKEAHLLISKLQPDVIITSDDNAFKYVIEPYYKTLSIPIVFCGINWDKSISKMSYHNTTGMIEIELIPQLISLLQKQNPGTRYGFLSSNLYTDQKVITYINKHLEIHFEKISLVDTFSDWMIEFEQMQNDVDLLILLYT